MREKLSGGKAQWLRHGRDLIYVAENRCRYPGVCQVAGGKKLLTFTLRSPVEERNGGGRLVGMIRNPQFEGWLRPRTLFADDTHEPRALGTITLLQTGELVLPFALVSKNQEESCLVFLRSQDNGDSWEVIRPRLKHDYQWLMPRGKILERNGKLLLPVFGTLAKTDIRDARFACGFLESSDRGESWHQGPLIASDPTGAYSYEYPAVFSVGSLPAEACNTGDNVLGAIVTRRSRQPGIDARQYLVKMYSTDAGESWTAPQALVPGAWPSVVSIGTSTSAESSTRYPEPVYFCSYSIWSGWGEQRVLVSHDGFETFHQDLLSLELGWLPVPEDYPKTSLYPDKELKIEPGRNYWAYNPLPLPPVVPGVSGDWRPGHYGFADSCVAENGNVVFYQANRQKGSVYTDPSESLDLPVNKERIEAITFRLDCTSETGGDDLPTGLAATEAVESRRSRGSMASEGSPAWLLSDSLAPEEGDAVLPNPMRVPYPPEIKDALYACLDDHLVEHILDTLPVRAFQTRTGTMVAPFATWTKSYTEGTNRIIGQERGYWVRAGQEGLDYGMAFTPHVSSDGGTTWEKAKVHGNPFLVTYPWGVIFEDEQGFVNVPFYGYLSEEDLHCSLYACGLARSRDGGNTWKDWGLIAYDREGQYQAYSENVVLPVKPDLWIAFIRTEVRTSVPWMGGMVSRAVSNDFGKTWSRPEIAVPGSQPAAVSFSDGSIALVVRTHGRSAPAVYFSRDYGATWDYALAGPYNTLAAGLGDDGTFWINANNEVLIYRKSGTA